MTSLLGMANYCSRFIPAYATLTQPLRELTKKDTPGKHPKQTRQPLQMSPLPDGPWEEGSVDFKELTREGYLLVIYDDYSRYPSQGPRQIWSTACRAFGQRTAART